MSGPERTDNGDDFPLGEMLRAEVPSPDGDYFARIEAMAEEHLGAGAAGVDLGTGAQAVETTISESTETIVPPNRLRVMDTTIPRPENQPSSNRTLFALAAGLLIVVGGLGAWALGRNTGDDQVAATDQTTTQPDPAAEPDPAGEPDSAPATTTSGASESTVTEPAPTEPPKAAQALESFQYPEIGNVAFVDGVALGWFSDNEWFEFPSDSDDVDAPELAAGPVNYVSQDGSTVTVEKSAIEPQCTEVGNIWTVGDAADSDGLVGTTGDWVLRPSDVGPISPAPEHAQTVADLLTAQGVSNPDVRITKVLRSDIDGDGVDEVLISAERLVTLEGEDTDALLGLSEGSYSLVLMRRLDAAGNVEVVEIASSVVDEANASRDNFGGLVDYYRIVDLADLDGDGQLELVVASGYFEGSSIGIYKLLSTPSLVVSTGCGV